ncbi:transposase [Streptomyces alanosinicus]|uniref:transposase n=1 Tax=Streptomyces alanosinicus TaxID=68171 RepID=UPI00357178E5
MFLSRCRDNGKYINGRKRHLLVDQDGLLVDLLVTPADVQDRDAARVLLTRLHAEHPEIVLVWADNGYGGDEFSTWAQTALGITVKVVSRPKDAKGFVLLPKRWVVERSNSWTMRARRNARDYERLIVSRGSPHPVGLHHPHVPPPVPPAPPPHGGPCQPRGSRLKNKLQKLA